MKVCIITPIYHPYAHGGLEAYAMELVHRLRSRGHEVAVITRGERDGYIPDGEYGEVHQIRRFAFKPFLNCSRKPGEWIATHMNEMFSSHGAKVVSRLVAKIKPDVIFSQAFYGFGRKMPQTLAGLGIPWLHYVHSYGLVCKRQTAASRNGAPCELQCMDCKVICRFKHGAEPLRNAVVIYNSASMKAFCEQAGLAGAESYIVDPVFTYKSAEQLAAYQPSRPIRLAYVGRVSREKGIHLVCDAVAERSGDFQLEVMGAGTMLDELRARHERAPITFHGRVSPEQRDALLRGAHALVVPSIWNEPFGRVVQEGFLAGLPVIASDVGAMSSMVRHGIDGIVYQWKAGFETASVAAALDTAAPLLPRLRLGALETRTGLLEKDNFGLIEALLLRAAAPKHEEAGVA